MASASWNSGNLSSLFFSKAEVQYFVDSPDTLTSSVDIRHSNNPVFFYLEKESIHLMGCPLFRKRFRVINIIIHNIIIKMAISWTFTQVRSWEIILYDCNSQVPIRPCELQGWWRGEAVPTDPGGPCLLRFCLCDGLHSSGASLVPQWWRTACRNRRHRRCGFDPWVGKISGGGRGNPLKYSYLENPMGRESWWATVRGVAKSRNMTEAT